MLDSKLIELEAFLREHVDDDDANTVKETMAENERLRAALKPFALIGLDVKKEHPGWANNVFSGQWCGYGLTYLQFARAAELFDDEQSTEGKDGRA